MNNVYVCVYNTICILAFAISLLYLFIYTYPYCTILATPFLYSYILTYAYAYTETLLGDSAVCVHPDDERYQHYIGKMVRVPMTDREVPG